jgi:hypothetical protein
MERICWSRNSVSILPSFDHHQLVGEDGTGIMTGEEVGVEAEDEAGAQAGTERMLRIDSAVQAR